MARSRSPQDEDTEEFLQDSPNRAEKRAIGPAMAERILDGQSVFIDSGSTCLEVARALDARRVTVVTHDLLVGLEILKKPSLNLVFVGGELLPNRTTCGADGHRSAGAHPREHGRFRREFGDGGRHLRVHRLFD